MSDEIISALVIAILLWVGAPIVVRVKEKDDDA